MIEFEKWYEENCDFSPTGKWADKYVKEAWKAALEWVADKCRGRRSKELYDLLEEIDNELLSK